MGKIQLTHAGNNLNVTVELGTSYLAEHRHRHGGLFVPTLWREAGSGNAPAFPDKGSTSRRQGGLEASLAASCNANLEAQTMHDNTTNLSKAICRTYGKISFDLIAALDAVNHANEAFGLAIDTTTIQAAINDLAEQTDAVAASVKTVGREVA